MREGQAPGAPEPVAERIETRDALDEALALRWRVFVEEQQVPPEEELDHHDGTPDEVRSAVHVLVRAGPGGPAVATGRLLLDHAGDEYPHVGRVAVLAEFRRLGYGGTVMEALQAEARRRGCPGITLAAQLHAIPFYERLGYVARGDVFLDAGIEHRWMDLVFDA